MLDNETKYLLGQLCNRKVAFFRTIKDSSKIPSCYVDYRMIVYYRERDDKYVVLKSPEGPMSHGLSLDSLYGLLIKYGINIDNTSVPCGPRGAACQLDKFR